MWNELAHSLQSGDGFVIALLVLLFVAMVITFERLIMLRFVYTIDFTKFIRNLKKMISAEDLDRAMTLCKSVSHTSLPLITLRALEAAETDPTTVRATIEEETIDFLPRLERRIAVLPTLATLIMLVGILGTIHGLWDAFHSIDVLDTAKKQSSLAHGIAGSLSPTAMALMASMMVLAGHQFLRSIALTITDRIHHGIAVLHNLLVPADVAYMPVAAQGLAVAGSSSAASAEPVPAGGSFDAGGNVAAPVVQSTGTKGGVTADDSFDDAAVDNLKDEEEII